jgi:hypothetical protein
MLVEMLFGVGRSLGTVAKGARRFECVIVKGRTIIVPMEAAKATTGMSACPIAVINAPLEQVWDLLSVPARFDDWWEAKTESIDPPGPAQPGQVIGARLGRWLAMKVVVDGVDSARHHVDLTTSLPFGFTGHNHITCIPLAEDRCQVTFGCDFDISPPWWAWLWEHPLADQLAASVAKALDRLKRAAEREPIPIS